MANDALTLSEPVPARVARAELDYYPTPRWVVHAIKPYLPPARRVFDPAAGHGELLDWIGAEHGEGIELDPARAKYANGTNGMDLCIEGDGLVLQWPNADLCLMNPPFTHARQFIERAIEWRKQDPRRTVACLARLTILESEERRVMHQQNPSDVYVLSKRPSFALNRHGKPATDSVTAIWMVWGPGRGGRWSVL